jgi:hypothetical protein
MYSRANGKAAGAPGREYFAEIRGLTPVARRCTGQYIWLIPNRGRPNVNEDVFNMEIRKFLKLVGVTSQREIETAVRAAVAAGRLKGTEKLKTRVVLTIDAAGLAKTIDGEIALT